MGRISTHVLDTAGGKPAAGLQVVILRSDDGGFHEVFRTSTNADGRTDAPLLEGEALRPGLHEIVYSVGPYFGPACFYDTVPVRFRVTDPGAHYHVALLITPWSYSTYRGS